MEKFINLHTNSEYSLLESTIKIDDLILFAKENQLNTLVLTDHNNMYGVPYFLQQTKKNNIKPIIGIDLDVDDFRLILLAKNYDGYLELIKLSSKKMSNQNISIEDIDPENIFVIDHPRYGYYYKYKQYININNYFVGLSHGTDPNGVAIFETKTLNEDLIGLSLLKCIKENKLLETIDNIEQTCFKFILNPKMDNAMILQAISIANECNIVFPKVKKLMPKFQHDTKSTSNNYLKNKLLSSLSELFKKNPNLNNEEYLARCKYEFDIIKQLDFSDYFLVLADIIQWAKGRKIMVGPGRGSASGSLIAYLLGITEIDPIKFNLLFERFLNSKRVNMPDIDVDIQDNRRDEVINYIVKKYSRNHVAQIITFSIMGAKMAMRDVGRALNINSREIDNLTQYIKSNKNGSTFSLEETFNSQPAFRSIIESSDLYKKLFNYSKKIEGLPRQIGTHAAGIVICSKKISNFIPVMTNEEGILHTQYSMNFLESNGLLKIDLLGLKNLTIIQEIQAEIFNNFKHKVNLHKINFALPKVNKLLSNADTNGIFQLESWGMKKALQTVKINSLNDLIAVIALFRPGPIDQIIEYANRKNNNSKFEHIDSSISCILKETYGIIIYQEQIMQIVQVFAGMSMEQADIFRRAISKKNKDKLTSLKSEFLSKSIARGRTSKKANEVWELIIKFAAYGFNKSHAVAYGMISYWMAYLKALFPIEFYIPLLNSSISSQTTTKKYINEVKAKVIKIISPSINLSMKKYFNKENKIYMPLLCIKGLGNFANDKIINERIENGKYKTFIDFIVRAKKNSISDSIITSLIESNSLREFGNVNSLIASLSPALQFANIVIVKRNDKVIIDDSFVSIPLIIKIPCDIAYEVFCEKKYFGMQLNVFLTNMYKSKNKLIDLNEKSSITCIAQIERLQRINTKYGELIFAKIFDSSIQIEVIIDREVFKFYPKLKKDEIYEFVIMKKIYNGKTIYKVLKMEKKIDNVRIT